MSQLAPRVIDIGVAGSPTTILATVYCRRWKVRESLVKADGTTANTPQGFSVQPADNSSNANKSSPTYGPPVYRAAASTTNEPGNFPEYNYPESDDASFHGPLGSPVAKGPDVLLGVGVTVAQPLGKFASLTATATTLEVIEEF